MKTLTVKVPGALDTRLEAFSRRQRVKRSVVVRQALTQYLSRGERSSGDSFLDLARDLAGCVNGPRDLSVAEKHTKGYGR